MHTQISVVLTYISNKQTRKIFTITIASKKNKLPRINSTLEVQYLYTENYKILLQ